MMLILAVVASILAARIALATYFPHRALHDRALLAFALWLLFMQATPIASGVLTGRFDELVVSLGFVALVCVALVARGAVLAVRGERGSVFRLRDGSLAIDLLRVAKDARGATKLAWAMVLVFSASMAVPGWLLPPRAWDSDYHSEQPIHWVSTGKFALYAYGPEDEIAEPPRGETSPNLKAGFVGLLALQRKSFDGASTIQFLHLLLLFGSVAAMVRRLGLPGWAGACGAALVATMPEVLLQQVELYADLVAAGSMAFALWALHALVTDAPGSGHGRCVALGVALLAAAKASLLPAAALIALVAMVAVCRSVGLRAALRLAGAAAVLSMLLSGMWYGNAIAKYRNPIAPYRVTVAGKELLPGTVPAGVNTILLKNNTGRTEAQAYLAMLTEPLEQTALSNWLGGLGPGWPVLGIPALLLFAAAAFDPNDPKRRAVALLGAVAVGLWSVLPDLWWPPFALQLMPVVAVAFAFALERCHWSLCSAWIVALLAIAAWNTFRAVPSWQYRRRAPIVWAYPFVTADARPMQLNNFPDYLSAVDVAIDSSCMNAKARSHRVGYRTHSIPAAVRRSWKVDHGFRAVLPPMQRGPEEWAEDLWNRRDLGYIIWRLDSPEAEVMRALPERFHLVYEERSVRSEHPWGPANDGERPRHAIWELLP